MNTQNKEIIFSYDEKLALSFDDREAENQRINPEDDPSIVFTYDEEQALQGGYSEQD